MNAESNDDWSHSKVNKPANSITELYFGASNLTTMKSLAQYTNLQKLWLNSNQLRTLKMINQDYSFIRFNYRITELHLQSNELITITGTLSHLHCLQVLMLHNNQLSDLRATVNELTSIDTLKRLNFFGNPMALDEGYRSLVIYSLPSVKVLDREEILDTERLLAQKLNNQFNKIRNQIGFMRKVETQPPPKKMNFPNGGTSILNTQATSTQVNTQTNNAINFKLEYEFTTFDWSQQETEADISDNDHFVNVVPMPSNKITVKYS